MKILVFVEGTILQHPTADQLKDFSSYVPVGAAVKTVANWVENGAEVSYLTSRVKFLEIKQITDVLVKFNFPFADKVHARAGTESYLDVVNKIKPEVLVEDDCQSIGADEMITPKLKPESGVHGIVVAEFGGIDHLPNQPEELKEYGKKAEETVEAEQD